MKRILYSNYDLYDGYDDTKEMIMEEYPEFCTVEVEDEEGNICYEPSDEKIWDFLYDDDELNWDSIYRSMKKFFDGKTVICYGTIRRWCGNYTGTKLGDFEEVLHAIIDDCDYVEIATENGHLYIRATHHDGSNSLELKTVTDKGIAYADNWNYSSEKKYDYSEHTMHTHIINCSFLSRLPRFIY